MITYRDDLTRFSPQQPVIIILPNGRTRTLVAALVLEVGRDLMRMAVRTPLPLGAALHAGMIVRLRDKDDRPIRVQLLAIEQRSPLVVAVRAVTVARRIQEQRGYYRALLHQSEATLAQSSGDSAVRLRVQLLDLSGDGARVLARRKLAVDQPLELKVQLNDAEAPVTIPARVVWQQALAGGWQAGLQFSGLNGGERDRLLRAVLLTDVRQRQAS